MIYDCMVARNSAKHSSLLSDLVARWQSLEGIARHSKVYIVKYYVTRYIYVISGYAYWGVAYMKTANWPKFVLSYCTKISMNWIKIIPTMWVEGLWSFQRMRAGIGKMVIYKYEGKEVNIFLYLPHFITPMKGLSLRCLDSLLLNFRQQFRLQKPLLVETCELLELLRNAAWPTAWQIRYLYHAVRLRTSTVTFQRSIHDLGGRLKKDVSKV